jgi:hypothetical protein
MGAPAGRRAALALQPVLAASMPVFERMAPVEAVAERALAALGAVEEECAVPGVVAAECKPYDYFFRSMFLTLLAMFTMAERQSYAYPIAKLAK